MISDVSFGPEQALLFAGPQGQPNRSPRLDAQRLQDSHGFEGNSATDGVVGRARPAVPRIKMSAEHDQLILQITAWNFRDDVEAIEIIGVVAAGNVDLKLHGRAFL